MDKRILIVDDDPGIRLLYEKELSQAGFTVTTVATGQEALEKAGENRFHLAILDIEIPDISGLEVLNRMRQINPEMSVILNSAYTVYKSDFQSWLADAYVVKSSDLKPLYNEINKLLG